MPVRLLLLLGRLIRHSRNGGSCPTGWLALRLTLRLLALPLLKLRHHVLRTGLHARCISLLNRRGGATGLAVAASGRPIHTGRLTLRRLLHRLRSLTGAGVCMDCWGAWVSGESHLALRLRLSALLPERSQVTDRTPPVAVAALRGPVALAGIAAFLLRFLLLLAAAG